MTHKIERKVTNNLRTEIIGRLEKLKDEIKDMDTYVRQDIDDKNLRDEDIFRINEKIKDLEKQIINVIEGWWFGDGGKNYGKQVFKWSNYWK